MKRCTRCGIDYQDTANYCVNCGSALSARSPARGREQRKAGFDVFFLTLAGSLLLSWVLIAVFNLPIFILGAFLPLFWMRGRRD